MNYFKYNLKRFNITQLEASKALEINLQRVNSLYHMNARQFEAKCYKSEFDRMLNLFSQCELYLNY